MNYKMLVVDDSNKDRRVIRESVTWSDYGIEIVGECANGLEALSFIDKIPVDIVITDVSMPVMNGVELAKRAIEKLPSLRILFMSFYEDFEYVKSAIDMQLCGYVVKPIVKNELLEVILRITDVYKKEQRAKDEYEMLSRRIMESVPVLRDNFVRNLLLGIPDNTDVRNKLDFLCLQIFERSLFQVLCLKLVNINEENGFAREYETRHEFIKHVDLVKKLDDVYVLQNTADDFVIIMCKDFFEKDSMADAMELYEKLSQAGEAEFKMGISLVEQGRGSLHRLYGQAYKAVNSELYGVNIPIIPYSEMTENKTDGDSGIYADEIYTRLEELITGRENKEIVTFLDDYIPGGTNSKSSYYVRYLSFAVLNALQILLLKQQKSYRDIFGDELAVWKKLNAFDTISSVRAWLLQTIMEVKAAVSGELGSRNNIMTEKIKEIIHARYGEAITLADICSEVYISTKQANNIFKQQVGESIFDYLVSYRTEVAKKLLRETDKRIYQIALDVGYSNNSHFCALFKKAVGLSPKDYRG